LTPNGKTDRRALERLDVNFESSRQYVAPRSGTEIQVATIFAEILKIRLEKIGVNDNFFELGGHSLLATQVISKVRQTFELDLPMKALFEDGTVVAMAALITAMRDPDPGMLEMEADEFEEVSL
jgi:acyl carrier protein